MNGIGAFTGVAPGPKEWAGARASGGIRRRGLLRHASGSPVPGGDPFAGEQAGRQAVLGK
jgi:hypothetical protein